MIGTEREKIIMEEQNFSSSTLSKVICWRPFDLRTLHLALVIISFHIIHLPIAIFSIISIKQHRCLFIVRVRIYFSYNMCAISLIHSVVILLRNIQYSLKPRSFLHAGLLYRREWTRESHQLVFLKAGTVLNPLSMSV